MKQTNNAIKFLMAQYRAIFKNANIAMVAAMVASALAAGQANAAPISLGASADKVAPSIDVTATDATAAATGGYVNKLTIKNGGILTFDGSANANQNHIRVGELLTVESGGKLILKGKVGTNNDGAGLGIVGTFDDSFDDKDSSLKVTGGTVEITASQLQMNHVDLKDATVTIGTNIQDDYGKGSDFSDNSQISVVANPAGGGDFTVSGKSTLNLQSGSIITAEELNLNGGTINMSGKAASGEAAVLRAHGSSVVNIAGADIKTTESGNYIGGAQINMTSGSITVSGTSVLPIRVNGIA